MDKNYMEYTPGLVLLDNAPVVLFLISGLLIYSHFHSRLFLVSVIAMFLGGASKVLWKMIIVAYKKDAAILTKAFRVLMFGGAGVMVLSVLLGTGQGVLADFARGFTSMPSMLFFIIGIAGMCAMGYLGKQMDTSLRSNWIEEAVNTVSQLAIMIGLILL